MHQIESYRIVFSQAAQMKMHYLVPLTTSLNTKVKVHALT